MCRESIELTLSRSRAVVGRREAREERRGASEERLETFDSPDDDADIDERLEDDFLQAIETAIETRRIFLFVVVLDLELSSPNLLSSTLLYKYLYSKMIYQ